MSEVLGVGPFELMERTPHREYLLWEWWFRERPGHPSSTELYLMQVAQCVRQVLSKHPDKIHLKHFLLKYGRKSGVRQKPSKTDLEQVKQAWLGRVGTAAKGAPK